MGEQNLGDLSLSQQVEHEQAMASAGKRLGEFIEKNRATPDVIVTATERAMGYVIAGGISPEETPDTDTAEIFDIMKAVTDSFKSFGKEIDPKEIVQELLLNLPTKGAQSAKIPQQISQAVQSVTQALSGIEIKEPPTPASMTPLVHGKPYSQELIEQATLKPAAAEIKPHGWSTINAAVTVAAVGAVVAAGAVVYGIAQFPAGQIIDAVTNLVGEAQKATGGTGIGADKNRATELSNLFAKDPYQILTETGWKQLFERINEQDEGIILVKYKGPNWWTKLLDKYPPTSDSTNDNLVEQHRLTALDAIRSALKEKTIGDLEKYRNNPNMVWTRLKDLGFSPEIYNLYRVTTNPTKNDYKEFEYWQKRDFNQINSRPEQRGWTIPISFLDARPELKTRISTVMFLSTFAAYPGLLDPLKQVVAGRESLSVDDAQSIINDPNIKKGLTRRDFLKVSARLLGSAIAKKAGI